MLSKVLSTHTAGTGCNEIGFRPVFFTAPWLDMLVSVTGAREISPAPVKAHSVSSSLTHLAANPTVPLPVLGVGWGKVRGAAAVVLPGEVSRNVSQPHLAWDCVYQGLQDFWSYPHPLPKSTCHVSVWLAGLKSSRWLFDRCVLNKTRKDAEKDAKSRKPLINIKA